jgi:hypothetical protein
MCDGAELGRIRRRRLRGAVAGDEDADVTTRAADHQAPRARFQSPSGDGGQQTEDRERNVNLEPPVLNESHQCPDTECEGEYPEDPAKDQLNEVLNRSGNIVRARGRVLEV